MMKNKAFYYAIKSNLQKILNIILPFYANALRMHCECIANACERIAQINFFNLKLQKQKNKEVL